MVEEGDRDKSERHGWWPGPAAVDVLLLPALLLPWVDDSGAELTGLELGWWLPAITVLTVLGHVSLAVLRPPWWRGRVRRAATVAAAGLLAVSALGAAIVTAQDERGDLVAAGSLSFVAVTVLAAVVDLRVPGASGPVRLHDRAMLVGSAGLVAAAVGVLGTWERITGPAARALSGGGDLAWSGAELATTLPLRWLLGALVAATVLLLAVPRMRVVLPVVLLAGGAGVAALAGAAAASIPRRAITAELLPGAGVWLALTGGAVAVAGGLVALGTYRRRVATPAVAVAAVALGLLAPPAAPAPVARAADPGDATVLFADPSDYDFRIGGPVRDAQVGIDNEQGVDAVDDREGRTWFLSSTRLNGRRVAVVSQVVGDRALPVTVIRSDYLEPRLVAVSAGHAIVQTELDVLNRIDLSAGDVDPERAYSSTFADDTGAAAVRASPGGGRGGVDARSLRVNGLPDGGVSVAAIGGEAGVREYLVPARTVAGPAPWPLPAPLPPRSGAVSPRSGVTLERTDTGLRQVGGGADATVLARTTDPSCRLSRDPLTLPDAQIFVTGQAALARDAAGNLFVRIFVDDQDSGLFVVTPAGELRRIRVPGDVKTVQATPAGSLIVMTAGDSADVPTAGRTVRAGAPVAVPTGGVTLLGPDGTRLLRSYADDTATLSRVASDGTTRRVARAGGDIVGVTADGRGGAWWFAKQADTVGLSHVDAGGDVRRVAVPAAAVATVENRNVVTAVDAADGSLYWRASVPTNTRWYRTTLDGATGRTGVIGYTVQVGDGVAYLQDTGPGGLKRRTSAGAETPALGYASRTTSVVAAVLRGGGPAVIPPEGYVADAQGRLLVWQGRWLGRVDGGRVTMLSGPADGLPDRSDVDEPTVVGDELIFVADGRVRRVDVR